MSLAIELRHHMERVKEIVYVTYLIFKMRRHRDKLNNWPKATQWLMISSFALRLCSLQLTDPHKGLQNSLLPIDETSDTYSQQSLSSTVQTSCTLSQHILARLLDRLLILLFLPTERCLQRLPHA